MSEEKEGHKRRVNGIHADVGPKRFLQWVPLMTSVVLILITGMIAFFNLKGDVRAQTDALKASEKNMSDRAEVAKEQRNLSRTRIWQNEQSVNELKTQTAVIINILEANEKSRNDLNKTMQDALREMRKVR